MFRRWSGEKVRQRRRELHLTQAEIAERLGVQRTTVVTWEQGEHPQLRYAAALADLLAVPLDQLFVHAGDAATATGTDGSSTSEPPANDDAPLAVVPGGTSSGDQRGAPTEE